MARPPEDLKGQRFYHLLALEDIGARKSGGHSLGRVWLCRCDCGRQTRAIATRLLRGLRKTCGCGQCGRYGSHRAPA